MSTELVETALKCLFVAIWIAAAIAWGFAAYFMLKTMRRFYPGREWGKYIPISVFLPWFFTDEGNSYRAKLLRAVSIFLVCVAAEIGLAFTIESISPTGAIDREYSRQSESSAVTQNQRHVAIGAVRF